jgi:hypothetical protein
MEAHRGEVARWLDVLAAKGVQELAFMNRPWPLDIRLPATLFRCASLTRLHLGVWRFPDTAAVPRSATFPNLRELGLSLITMDERDLTFLLDRSPILETLTMIWLQPGVRLRLVSRTLRCLQLCITKVEDVALVDAPLLERFLMFMAGLSKTHSRIKIGRAPNLRVLGYLEPREHVLEIGNTVISVCSALHLNLPVSVDNAYQYALLIGFFFVSCRLELRRAQAQLSRVSRSWHWR